MAFSLRCGCGKLLDIEERFAGQPVQCPYCKGVLQTPAGMAALNPINETEAKQKQEAAEKKQIGDNLAELGELLLFVGLGIFLTFTLRHQGIVEMGRGECLVLGTVIGICAGCHWLSRNKK